MGISMEGAILGTEEEESHWSKMGQKLNCIFLIQSFHMKSEVEGALKKSREHRQRPECGVSCVSQLSAGVSGS
jgi:hypothetical protein